MARAAHMGWMVEYDEATGIVNRIGREGNIDAHQSAEPMLTLVVGGQSTANNQQQMHNIELYKELGRRPRMIAHRWEAPVLTIETALEDGFTMRCQYVFCADWVKMTADIAYMGDEPVRMRWLNWRHVIQDEKMLSRAEPFCPGYTPQRSEPYDLKRPIGAYQHEELLAHDLFGDHVPAYRPGFLGLYLPEDRKCAFSWFISEMFPCYTKRWTHSDALIRHAQVHAPRWMRRGDRQTVGTFYFTTLVGDRNACIDKAVQSYKPYGWDRSNDGKELRKLRVMEICVGDKAGRTLFDDYDQVVDRLDQIRYLGFNAIEIMPKMPFPSYSVYDMMDLDATYGDAAGLKRTIERAHELGMRVIVDMVFHGPLEYDEKGTNLFRSPYLDAHPDWFMRHESGTFARTYTRSFDMANLDYQRHIGDCMLYYLDTLAVDGFRLDAQMWSETPNWEEKTGRPAYESVLAGMRMMDAIAPRIHAKYPHAFFYTEANGPYSAKRHEYRYNYDMHWILPGLCPIVDPRGMSTHTLNLISQNTLSWQDAARWYHELIRTSPKGMAIVHQVDSHDSCEWGGYRGGQYNREAFGLSAHRVLYAMANFLDGGLMSFYGSQSGNEGFYAELGQLFAESEILKQGDCHYDRLCAQHPKVVTILYVHDGDMIGYIGNLLNEEVKTTIRLALPECADENARYALRDLLSDGEFIGEYMAQDLREGIAFTLSPHQTLVVEARRVLQEA